MSLVSYQTLHAPFGADASFALGLNAHGGGFQCSIERVQEQDVFIGIRDGSDIRCLPFFKEVANSAMDAFVTRDNKDVHHQLTAYPVKKIRRTLQMGRDLFEVEQLSFEFITPVGIIPEPYTAGFGDAILPAITARMTVDNRKGTHPVDGVFGISVVRGLMSLSQLTDGVLMGFASKDGYGFAVKAADDIEEFADFGLPDAYNRPRKSMVWVADMPALSFHVAAGNTRVVDIALGWYREGNVLCGAKRGSFFYTLHYMDLVGVLKQALMIAEQRILQANACDTGSLFPQISADRHQLMAQAIHSYYASSMLFETDGNPLYVVNEGSFRMMSTLDLLVDHAFLESRLHPWTLRNQLETFLRDYSYVDQCGLSFSHDFGTHHVFAPSGNSSYEVPNLNDCFSYMSQEQVCNWVLSASIYASASEDATWMTLRADSFRQLLQSIKNRDSMEGSPTGLMNLDSDRCGTGAEITTYDSLDTSLGQARRNLYLAVKCWATYLALGYLLDKEQDGIPAREARERAAHSATAITVFMDPDLGFIPAILDGVNSAPIIPAIEALVYPAFLGLPELSDTIGAHANLLAVLRQHAMSVIRPGLCLFSDGGWKLSANSDNSWISKIFICEWVAEKVLRLDLDYSAHDATHVNWWFNGCASNPGIDQIFHGTQTERGFHYPRGASSFLWLPANAFG